VEIYFSLIQRKVLTPNDFPNLDTLPERLLDFQYYWEATAKPFEWKFNRKDLNDLLDKLNMPSAKGPVTAPEYVGGRQRECAGLPTAQCDVLRSSSAPSGWKSK
jgi:hypothetical protein